MQKNWSILGNPNAQRRAVIHPHGWSLLISENSYSGVEDTASHGRIPTLGSKTFSSFLSLVKQINCKKIRKNTNVEFNNSEVFHDLGDDEHAVPDFKWAIEQPGDSELSVHYENEPNASQFVACWDYGSKRIDTIKLKAKHGVYDATELFSKFDKIGTTDRPDFAAMFEKRSDTDVTRYRHCIGDCAASPGTEAVWIGMKDTTGGFKDVWIKRAQILELAHVGPYEVRTTPKKANGADVAVLLMRPCYIIDNGKLILRGNQSGTLLEKIDANSPAEE
jgi:hypothetical protein